MPIIKSAKKRMRQTAARKALNQNTKRELRSSIKDFSSAIAKKDTKKAGEILKTVQSNLDTAVKKNVLKKNTAARKLSQLTSQAKTAGVKPTASTKKKAPAKTTASKTTASKKSVAKKPATKKSPAKKPATKK